MIDIKILQEKKRIIKINDEGVRFAHEIIDDLKSEPELSILKCIQCGRCSGNCPAARYSSYNPRQIIHEILLGNRDIIDRDDIWNCFSCYSCHANCPRNCSPCITNQILKQMAIEKGTGIGKIKRFLSYGDSFMEYGIGCIPTEFFGQLASDFGDRWMKLKLNLDDVRGGLGLRSMALPPDSTEEIRKILQKTGFAARLERIRKWNGEDGPHE